MEKTCLARTFHTFRVFILFFNVSVSYIIFTSCPSHFQKIEFYLKYDLSYLKYIWVKTN